MKNMNRSNRWIIAIVVATGFIAPAAALAAIHIELAVDNATSPPKLIVKSNPAQCSGGPINCIEVAKGNSPNLYFDLDKACSSAGPAYKLTQIRIAMVEKQWPSSSNPLFHTVADDFNADPDTGFINLTGSSNELKDDRIKFKDKNSNIYTVFYEITAMECEGSGEITLDPSIRNGGK